MQGNTDDTALERATIRRITWRLLPFLLLLYIISWLDRVNVRFAQLQLSTDLGFSNTIYGIGAGIFFLGYGLCEIPSNLLLARYGARVWIARIMITWGLISAGMMFITAEWNLYLMRFLLGLAGILAWDRLDRLDLDHPRPQPKPKLRITHIQIG